MKASARRLLRRLGVEAIAYEPRNFPHLRRPVLLADERIDTVVDGGAADGAWGHGLRTEGFTGRIVSFEPRPDAYERLQARAAADQGWTCHRVALGPEPGDADLHVSGFAQSSSLLPIGERHVRQDPSSSPVGTERVTVARLDDFLAEYGSRLFLKLDLQGYELPALRGGEQALERTCALEVELSAVSLYDGQDLLHEVVAHLHARGFGLIGLETSFRDRASGDLLQANGLFRRRA